MGMDRLWAQPNRGAARRSLQDAKIGLEERDVKGSPGNQRGSVQKPQPKGARKMPAGPAEAAPGLAQRRFRACDPHGPQAPPADARALRRRDTPPRIEPAYLPAVCSHRAGRCAPGAGSVPPPRSPPERDPGPGSKSGLCPAAGDSAPRTPAPPLPGLRPARPAGLPRGEGSQGAGLARPAARPALFRAALRLAAAARGAPGSHRTRAAGPNNPDGAPRIRTGLARGPGPAPQLPPELGSRVPAASGPGRRDAPSAAGRTPLGQPVRGRKRPGPATEPAGAAGGSPSGAAPRPA